MVKAGVRRAGRYDFAAMDHSKHWHLWLIPALAFAAAPGCSDRSPMAASTSAIQEPGEPVWVAEIDSTGRDSIQNAFESLSDGREADSTPVSVPEGRWSDIYLAVLYACDASEMAVVSKRFIVPGPDSSEPQRWEFRLRTVEDWPGRLEITRVHPTQNGQVYHATATIGHMGDQIDRAEQLLAAIESQMLAFGKKRQFSTD